MRFVHPGRRHLRAWGTGEPTTPALERHLATCSRCADRLEGMMGDGQEDIRRALLALLVVPDRLPHRLTAGIDQRLASRNEFTLIAEFFGLPLRTARIISTTETGDE